MHVCRPFGTSEAKQATVDRHGAHQLLELGAVGVRIPLQVALDLPLVLGESRSGSLMRCPAGRRCRRWSPGPRRPGVLRSSGRSTGRAPTSAPRLRSSGTWAPCRPGTMRAARAIRRHDGAPPPGCPSCSSVSPRSGQGHRRTSAVMPETPGTGRRTDPARQLAGAVAVVGRPGPRPDPPSHRTSCRRPGRPAAPIVASSADRRGSAIAGNSRSPGPIRSRPRAPRRFRVRAHDRLRTAAGARRPRDAADTSKREGQDPLDNRFAFIEARHGVFRSEVVMVYHLGRFGAPCAALRFDDVDFRAGAVSCRPQRSPARMSVTGTWRRRRAPRGGRRRCGPVRRSSGSSMPAALADALDALGGGEPGPPA